MLPRGRSGCGFCFEQVSQLLMLMLWPRSVGELPGVWDFLLRLDNDSHMHRLLLLRSRSRDRVPVNALAIWPDRRLVLSDVRTGESSHGSNIMHCAFGVNSLHTSNNNAHVITSISGLASRSQFFMLVRGHVMKVGVC